MKTMLRRRLAGLEAGACALAILTLAGCGGGGEAGTIHDHCTSTTERMTCAATCVPSDTLSAGQMEAHFYLEDDGTRTQAQAGFFHGFSVGYNVELGDEPLYFVRGTDSEAMALPLGYSASSGDPLGDPYLYDFAQRATAPVAAQFQLHHAGQVYVSSVTLPAPFNINSPANGTTYSKASAVVPIQLDSAQPQASWDVANANCKATDGTTWVDGGNDGASYFSTVDGRSVQFRAADYMASLKFTNTSTGAVAALVSCNITLQATVTSGGTMADGFEAGSSISGLQLRKVQIALK